jgi:hypothetical protein
MTGRPSALALALALSAAMCADVAGCSSPGGAARDGGPPETSLDLGVVVDRAPVCADATAPDTVEAAMPSGLSTCGGEVAVGGTTPYGAFVATNIRAQLGFGDCAGLSLTLDDGAGGDAGQTDATVLALFVTPQSQSWTGTYAGLGTITRGARRSGLVPAHVELTTADFVPTDGGSLSPGGVGPRGLLVGTIDVDTGCGHVTGAFSVPVCQWQTCIV